MHVDPSESSWEEDHRSFLIYHIDKMAEHEEILTHKLNSSTMYYHSGTEFERLYHKVLDQDLNESPQSSASEEVSKTKMLNRLP